MIHAGSSIQVERDVKVWSSKTYEDRPALVKEDQLIRKHRVWYSQFYSNNNNSKAKQEDDDEW